MCNTAERRLTLPSRGQLPGYALQLPLMSNVMPGETLLAAMRKFHEELAKVGVLVDASGLQSSAKGWRINYPGAATDERTVTDDPFAETKELIAGYTIIQVQSREEALDWIKRFPILPSMAGQVRSKCGSFSSWKISRRANRLSAFAK